MTDMLFQFLSSPLFTIHIMHFSGVWVSLLFPFTSLFPLLSPCTLVCGLEYNWHSTKNTFICVQRHVKWPCHMKLFWWDYRNEITQNVNKELWRLKRVLLKCMGKPVHLMKTSKRQLKNVCRFQNLLALCLPWSSCIERDSSQPLRLLNPSLVWKNKIINPNQPWILLSGHPKWDWKPLH